MSNNLDNPVNGHWESAVGSKLYLKADGSKLTGHFQSNEDPPLEVPIYGSVDNTDKDFIPIAFTAYWPPKLGEVPAVTSYTGQYSNENGKEIIETIFLLVNKTDSTILWKSTHIAYDIFTKH